MDMKLNRRTALGLLAGGSLAACKREPVTHRAETNGIAGQFTHGVASGDPLADRVIIWTRLSPADSPSGTALGVEWEVATDAEFKSIAKWGMEMARPANDMTVKVDVTGLEPGQWYFYRFKYGGTVSPVGRTRTLPEGDVPQARFAIVSCCNYQHGYFNVYDHITHAQTEGHGEFDALLHLGDYFYEYSQDDTTDAMKEAGRFHDPAHEIVSLEDYRRRHALYRTDPNLQAVTAQMPMISIWDDHESSNDAYKDGAQNHQPDEGDWARRKEYAMRAYYEWMPVRDPAQNRGREFLFRKFEWGNLLTLAAIETRLLARSVSFEFDTYYDELFEEESLQRVKEEKWLDPSRELMGSLQIDWLAKAFGQSKKDGKTWRLLANQVLMARMVTPDITPYISEDSVPEDSPYRDLIIRNMRMSPLSLPIYPDSWDGYPAERERLYKALTDAGVEDMIVVTGDAHEYFANDLTDEAGVAKGVEFCTTSVTSETRGDVLGESARDLAMLVTRDNKDVRYYNPMHKGYIDLTLTASKVRAKMVAVDTVNKTDYQAFRAAEFTVKKSGDSLKITDPQGLSTVQRALFSGLV